jgi:hypothetical protein
MFNFLQMKSLYSPDYVQKITKRINSLSAETKPQWGKMNAAQVMAHCTAPLKMAHGEIKGKRGLISFLFGKSAKKKYTHPETKFGKNLPTDPNFLFPSTVEFETERTKLNEFAQKGKAGITKEPHSFFGNMTPEEWDIIQSKHLDHHLSQFGV